MISIASKQRDRERRGETAWAPTHLLCALDLGWVMWIVVVDCKGELERAGLVHALKHRRKEH